MLIQLRRGTDSARASITLQQGEFYWATDTKVLWGGDGATAGGIQVGQGTGNISGSNHVTGNRPSYSTAQTVSVSPGLHVSPYTFSADIGGGSAGAYSLLLQLITTNATQGDLIRINLSIPASTNPTINIYNSSTGGTLLDTITNPAGTAQNWYAEYVYTGTAWEKSYSAYQVTS